jgi:putative transposase
MARKHRLEYPGAIYHVINRGNYRSWVFEDDGAKGSFEVCLFEACESYGWVLHAHVVMGNHYHLALETPGGNVVRGMQWLQATFANRFNRFRGERGHLFQGRYKALQVEPGAALGQLCHYIHLNPVRAGVVGVEELGGYRYASYWYLSRPQERPAFLRVGTALAAAGGLADTPAGHRSYAQYLQWQMEHGPAGKGKAYESMSRGWALGSGEFKRELRQEHKLAAATRAWDAQGAKELEQARWQEGLERALGALPAAAKTDGHKSAPWKVGVAGHLKQTLGVSNGWLAQRLGMGSAMYVSKHVSLARRQAGEAARLRAQLEEKEKGKA